MGWDDLDVGDWIIRGLYIFVALMVVAVLIIGVCMAIYAYYRRSLRGGAKTPAALSLDELLERIPDVTYQELSAGGASGRAAASDGDDEDRESCVICVAPYEPGGEACGVLPGCGHVFHKLCVAKWLRQKSTCPLCRTAFAVTDDAPQANAVSAIENMV